MTSYEFIILGMLAEAPRHGYALEKLISERGVREWADIGTSSLYFVLGKLETRGFIKAHQEGGVKSRKTFEPTAKGIEALKSGVLGALGECETRYSNLLPSLANWPIVEEKQAIAALQERRESLSGKIKYLSNTRDAQRPMPPFVSAMFEFSLGQMNAEIEWMEGYLESLGVK